MILPSSLFSTTQPLQQNSFLKAFVSLLRSSFSSSPWIVVKLFLPLRCCKRIWTMPFVTTWSSPSASAKGSNGAATPPSAVLSSVIKRVFAGVFVGEWAGAGAGVWRAVTKRRGVEHDNLRPARKQSARGLFMCVEGWRGTKNRRNWVCAAFHASTNYLPVCVE